MKRIYIRAGLSPLENLSPLQILKGNSIGDNVGNLIYAYSVFRSLMVDEDTEIVANHYKVNPKDAEKINEEYDCFVIPLADAFRKDFMPEMRRTTELIKKLTIPCVVIGVGLRAPFEPKLNQSFEFDEDVREFVKAVLDKSAIVGVRGEITSDYLTKLGFREGIDHTVIGCPSMYMFGKDLKVRDLNLTTDSIVSVNNSVMSPNNVQNFLERSMMQLPNHYYLPQRIDELRLLYAGTPYSHVQKRPTYPCTLDARLYAEDRVKFFNSAVTWIDFLSKVDLSFGARLHGNITAILAGAPALLIPHDARMRELTEYHNITHVWAKDIKEDTNLFDLVQKLDFKQVLNGHDKRFEHYVDFLNKNGLEHIFKDGVNPDEAPLDKKMKELDLYEPIKSIRNCSLDEMIERWNNYYPTYNRNLAKMKERALKAEKESADYKRKLQQEEKRVKELERECESCSISKKMARCISYAKNKIKK